MLSSLILLTALTAPNLTVANGWCGPAYYGPSPFYYPYTYYWYYPAYAPACYPSYYLQMPYIAPCPPVEVVVEKESKDKGSDRGDAASRLEKKIDALGDLLLNFEKRLLNLEKRLDKLEKNTPAKETRKPLGNRALVTVRLPADATLYLDGKETRTNQQYVRTILTPELEKGASYRYELQAEVIRAGERIRQTQRVSFQAGRQVEVNFDLPGTVVAQR